MLFKLKFLFFFLVLVNPTISEFIDYEDFELNTEETVIQRYNCFSCESPNCQNSTDEANFCENAIQCWKSRVRGLYGEERVSRGCTTSFQQLHLFCNKNKFNDDVKGMLKRHAVGQYNITCCSGDYCNDGHFPSLPGINQLNGDSIEIDSLTNTFFIILFFEIFGPIAIISGLAIAIIFFMRNNHRKRLLKSQSKNDPEQGYITENDLQLAPIATDTLEEFFDDTDGSGSGLPFLKQRTLAQQVTLQHSIGGGRYGAVYKGIWHGESVAVKIFSNIDENSWIRETEIYTTIQLRHKNILGYIGSDINAKIDYTQLWLVTHFYESGSLYDYLKYTPLTHHQMVTICLSITNGLDHLHTNIFGTEQKPGIAHRDIKSKNILVGLRDSCVIADFGLAVTNTQLTKKQNLNSNPRVGTKRYMSPEVLDESINMECFEAFQRADIYSLALVFWEVCRRTLTSGLADEYMIPFQDIVPGDPSFEEMKKVICGDHVRPSLPNRWNDDPLLTGMSKLMRECWHKNSNVRLPALCVKKTLLKLAASDETVKLNYDGGEICL